MRKYLDKIDFHKSSFWLIVLALVFLISLTTYIFSPQKKLNRVVFFYNETNNMLEGENRRIRPKTSKEEDIKALINELALGPQKITHKEIMPKSTQINSILLRGKIIFLDFSIDLLFDKEDIEYNLNDVISVINKTVEFNFPWVKKIIITVNGQEPLVGL